MTEAPHCAQPAGEDAARRADRIRHCHNVRVGRARATCSSAMTRIRILPVYTESPHPTPHRHRTWSKEWPAEPASRGAVRRACHHADAKSPSPITPFFCVTLVTRARE